MSYIPQDLIKQWADLTANNENYAKAAPEQKAAAQMEYFTNAIAPKVSPADSEKAQLEWAYTVLDDPSAVYQNSSFLSMPEEERKRVLRGRIIASGQEVSNEEKGPGFIERTLRAQPVSGAIYNAVAGEPKPTFDPKVEAAYDEFQADPGVSSLRRESYRAEAAKPLNYLKRNVSALIPGDKAKEWTAEANDYALRTQQLEETFPESKAIGTAATMAAAAPAAVGIEAALPIAGIGTWLANAGAQGLAATPLMGQPVDPNSKDVKGDVRSQQAVDALTNTAVGGAVTGVMSPVVRNTAARLGARLEGPAAVAGSQLASGTRAAGVGVADEQLIKQLEGEQQALWQAKEPVMFTGAKSGSDTLADMQVNVPGQNPTAVELNQFQRPVNAELAGVEAAAPKDSNFLTRAQEYIKTKIRPQTVAEFNIAKKQAVNTLEKDGKDFVNKVYQGARESGVLNEPLGISQNQLSARTEDLLKDPNIQKYGVDKLPSVQSLLRQTDGAAQLTVDDAMRLQIGLADDFKATKAEGLKPFIDLVSDTLDGSQVAGVKQLRNTVSEYQNFLDENINLTKAQFDASAALEKTLATKPLRKAISTGNAEGVAKAFKSNIPENELAETIADVNTHKALKASISADIADSLGSSPLSGKEKVFDTKAFYKEYGSDEAFNKLKTLFAGEDEYIKQLEAARASGRAATEFANRKGVASTAKNDKIAGQLASGGGGELTGVRTQLTNASANAISNFFNKKTRQYINDSVGNKAKAMLIFDKAIKAQKGRTNYKQIYNEVVVPTLNQIAPKASMARDSDVKSPPLKVTPNNYGKRADGTNKGKGYFGELKRPDGSISTELSIGVNMDGKEVQIPTLVPTLSKDEINYLLAGNKATKEIVQKAVDFAKERMKSGKSPFAD